MNEVPNMTIELVDSFGHRCSEGEYFSPLELLYVAREHYKEWLDYMIKEEFVDMGWAKEQVDQWDQELKDLIAQYDKAIALLSGHGFEEDRGFSETKE